MDQAAKPVLTPYPPLPEGVTFDEDSHTYYFEGVKVPNVSRVLAPLEHWDRISPSVMEAAQELGTAVHLATAFDDCNTLSEDSVDPAVRPYLECYRRFRRENAEIEILGVEEVAYHGALRVATRLDRRATIAKRHAVVDLKTGGKLHSHGVQVMAHRLLWNYRRPLPGHIKDCYTLYLNKEGQLAQLCPWTDPLHEREFVALLTDLQWRELYA
jgi:hypothetical protein